MKVGERSRCPSCGIEVIVVRAPAAAIEVSCDGTALVAADGAPASGGDPVPDDGGTQLGKRYADESSGLELLCTHGGAGTLEVGGTALTIRDAKSLPSSD